MDSKILNILKNAIILETRGKSFYTNAVSSINNDSVKKFFSDMADEEDKHLSFLKTQLKSIKKENKIDLTNIKNDNKPDTLVITDELKKQINLANYESTAVSVAILLEQNAYNFYRNLLEKTTNNDEKAIYKWLSDWEKEHLDSLVELEKYIKEQIWFDNQFWPI